MMNIHEKYMKAALLEAEKAKKEDEVPVGCVIVKDGKIIARGHNRREKTNLVISHAETTAIQKANKKLGTWCLKGCDLYVTLEPCMMCFGTIFHAQISNLYYGAADEKGGAVESMINVKKIKHINKHPHVYGGYLKEECSSILSEFFREKRRKQKVK